jgi:hypothetical protein
LRLAVAARTRQSAHAVQPLLAEFASSLLESGPIPLLLWRQHKSGLDSRESRVSESAHVVDIGLSAIRGGTAVAGLSAIRGGTALALLRMNQGRPGDHQCARTSKNGFPHGMPPTRFT